MYMDEHVCGCQKTISGVVSLEHSSCVSGSLAGPALSQWAPPDGQQTSGIDGLSPPSPPRSMTVIMCDHIQLSYVGSGGGPEVLMLAEKAL